MSDVRRAGMPHARALGSGIYDCVGMIGDNIYGMISDNIYGMIVDNIYG